MHFKATDAVLKFRRIYQKERIPQWYSGALHGLWISGFSLGVISFAAWHLKSPTGWELLSLPVFLLIASNVEYFFHRYFLHRRVPGLGIIFRLHTLEHHHYFTDDYMDFKASRDFNMVFFPHHAPVLITTIVSLLAYFIFRPLFSENVAWLFVICGVGHYLMYESIHFVSHLRPHSWVGRLRLVRFLRRHHALHHNLSAMGRANFNITLPICDWLYGTYRAE